MNRFICKALLTTIVLLVLVGCATMQIRKDTSNYLQKGMVSAKLQGNDFYMAIGEVDLYDYGLFGNLKPSGQTVEIAVAIQADKDRGEVLRIATMQSSNSSDIQNGVTVVGGASYVLSDLRGGMSVIDIQPYPRWLDAIQAMRNAITDLSTYTTFGSYQGGPSVAVYPGWSWGGFWHRHYRDWRYHHRR
jgi:hypothetical protein